MMTKEELIARIAEAYETYRRLPDPDRKYRVAKMASWPLYVRDIAEAYGYGDVGVRLAAPSPAAIDRADELLGWMAKYLTHYSMGAKLIWLTYGRGLALRECSRIIRRFRPRGYSVARMSVMRRAALSALLAGIAREGG